MNWKSSEIADLRGKVCVVTGANSGLGYQTALQLASKNAKVIMACRNFGKAADSRQQILKARPDSEVEIMQVDLGDFDSVRHFANEFNEKYQKLDLLINNAGIGGFPFSKSKDGFETHFAINHLGHYLLTGLLMEALKTAPKARIVSVSSIMNRIGNHDFSDVNYENRKYNKWHAYGRSKMANVLFSNELNRKLAKNNINAIAVTAHPGYSSTNFQEKGPQAFNSKLDELAMNVSNALFAQNEKMGALPVLYAACGSDIQGGDYVGPSFFRLRGYPAKQKARGAAYDTVMAAKLWKLSEEMTGFQYPF